eukprot:3941425-Rhodomonas_salina.3
MPYAMYGTGVYGTELGHVRYRCGRRRSCEGRRLKSRCLSAYPADTLSAYPTDTPVLLSPYPADTPESSGMVLRGMCGTGATGYAGYCGRALLVAALKEDLAKRDAERYCFCYPPTPTLVHDSPSSVFLYLASYAYHLRHIAPVLAALNEDLAKRDSEALGAALSLPV